MTVQHGDGYDQERAAVGALFTEEGRRDPHGVLAQLDLPTARFGVVEHLLRDPAFLRAGSRSEAPLWQMLGRWLISLDGDRHRRLRDRFVRAVRAAQRRALPEQGPQGDPCCRSDTGGPRSRGVMLALS